MQLQAFDEVMEFDHIRSALSRLIEYLNTDVADRIRAQITKYAEDNQLDAGSLLGNPVGPMVVSLSGFLSEDGSRWTMRGADPVNQPHIGATMIAPDRFPLD